MCVPSALPLGRLEGPLLGRQLLLLLGWRCCLAGRVWLAFGGGDRGEARGGVKGRRVVHGERSEALAAGRVLGKWREMMVVVPSTGGSEEE